MSRRTDRIAHIRCVECKAEEFDRQGYSVKADISGWSKPPTIGGLVPDIRAKKGGKIIIGKILNEEYLATGEEKLGPFISLAENDEGISFRVYMASEDGKPRLHRMAYYLFANVQPSFPNFLQKVYFRIKSRF